MTGLLPAMSLRLDIEETVLDVASTSSVALAIAITVLRCLLAMEGDMSMGREEEVGSEEDVTGRRGREKKWIRVEVENSMKGGNSPRKYTSLSKPATFSATLHNKGKLS